MTTRLITMGGTIDKDYFDALSEYQVVDSILIEEIKRIGIPFDATAESVCRKDSLEITDQDRSLLLEAIQLAPEDNILISHGTDTLVATANFLLNAGLQDNKRVILFGAMRPLRFKDTDGLFNAAFALGALAASGPGVYIAMSGRLFRPDEVVKNRSAGRFEAI